MSRLLELEQVRHNLIGRGLLRDTATVGAGGEAAPAVATTSPDRAVTGHVCGSSLPPSAPTEGSPAPAVAGHRTV